MKKLLVLFAVSALSGTAYASSDCKQASSLRKQSKQSGSAESRVELAKQAVDLCPKFINYYNLGNTLAKQSQIDQARKTYHKALSSARKLSHEALAHGRLAQLDHQQGANQTAEAMNRLDLAFDLFREAGVEPNSWVQQLRKQVEDALVDDSGIVSARSIEKVLSTRSFVVRQKIDLRILFELDKATITDQGMKQIRELRKALTANLASGQRLVLTGHTDAQGSVDHNLDLSRRRAEAVKVALLAEATGLSGNQVDVDWKGESQLLYTGNTEEDHRRNRRVEVLLK